VRSVLLLFVLCACHHAMPKPPPDPTLERVDVFGSHQLSREAVLERWGDRLVALMHATDDNRRPESSALENQIETEIRKAGSFALVRVSIISYFVPRLTYITIDLVDEADRARRMTFAPAPVGDVPDPDGLLALWDEYQHAAMQLLMDGTIKPKKEPCPFWHCITFAHESLAKYKDAFAARVQAHERELASVLRDDKRANHRAAAAFLLAHIASGERVVELMLPSIRDPEELVRNNAMRVLALIAADHPEIAIPLDPVIEALSFPTTTDRNKASAILDGLTKHGNLSDALRTDIRMRAGSVLVELLALRQPNNHDFAYKILKHVSGKDFGEHAIAAWRAWLKDGGR